MKTFTLCCTLLGLVVLGTRADNFTRPGHRKDWPAIDRLGQFADTIDWFAKFQERVYLVTKDDKVYAFGNQAHNEMLLGLNIARGANVSRPTEVVELRGKKIVKIVSSFRHMFALSAEGAVWAWGKNSFGELGIGQDYNHFTPVPVDKATNVIDIVATDYFSLALTNAGEVFAWGYNSEGQCGIGTTSLRQTTPVRVHLNQTARSLHTTAEGTSVVLAANSELYVWGTNAAASPTLLAVPSRQVSVATNLYYYYIVTEDGHIWESFNRRQLKVQLFYEGAIHFKALWADANEDNFLVGEATDGRLWMWADARHNWTPVLINATDVVQAFAVNHPKGLLPFMVKLGGGVTTSGPSTKTPTTSGRTSKTHTASVRP